jgi:hypothetical protein
MAASCNLSGATLFKPTFSDISSATAGVAAAQAATLTRAASDFDIMRSSERVESAIRRLEISNSSMQKAPFLPRLPEKIFQTYRLTSSHLINNSYVDNVIKTSNLKFRQFKLFNPLQLGHARYI